VEEKERGRKASYIRARVTPELKEKFVKQLELDGMTESDFLVTCVINYLGIKTIPEKNKK
jgi:hypothetical protein